jgi:hypothetical protein
MKEVHYTEWFVFAGHRYGPKETDGYTEGTLIEFSPSNSESYKTWTNVIEDFIGGIIISCNQEPGQYCFIILQIVGKFCDLNFKTIEQYR